MSFRPVKVSARAAVGVRMGYSTRRQKGKDKGNSVHLTFSICPDLVRALKAKEGDVLRLDLDMRAGMARLLPVGSLSPAARRLHVESSGRGDWSISYNGDVAEAFPLVEGMTELIGPHVSSEEGLIFDLPVAAKAEG